MPDNNTRIEFLNPHNSGETLVDRCIAFNEGLVNDLAILIAYYTAKINSLYTYDDSGNVLSTSNENIQKINTIS
ncbi:hypothetical protein [Ichthyobacterium seriolicida]|uniref:hypothetical protein n=1 Tax=Ichthyobacterium seriolicida TaxID=242600 RepID=UPI000BBC746A|nr:hypothetical protein [Ichthyobacterium seriolicida]